MLGLSVLALALGTTAVAPAPNPFGVAWGFLYGYEGVPAPTYLPELREIGGGWTKIYLIWNQCEPKKGVYDWSAVDKFIGQLKSPDEGLISVFSASTWATRTSTNMLPPSPAKDPADYDRFIRALVKHCHGKALYFQNDSEPNDPVYWSGTASEFAAETKIFSRAVRETDRHALVVLGGYDGLFNPGPGFKYPTQEAGLKFFKQVLDEAPNTFDLFDLRLYATPATIPARVEYIRQMMKAHGGEKPIVCTEYNGPGFFEFPPNQKYFQLIANWQAWVASNGVKDRPSGVSDLYKDEKSLAPQTQMFLMDADPKLEAKLRRLECFDMIERNVLALSAGVQRTMYWDFWHDTSKRDDLMTLMYGKLKFFELENGKFVSHFPVADAFRMMSRELRGVRGVKLLPLPDAPGVACFEADCGNRGTVLVLWKKGNADADDGSRIKASIAWSSANASAIDATGKWAETPIENGQITAQVGIAPIYIDSGK